MSSLDEANNFINCVMNRYKNDTIMRADAILLLIALPFMAIGFGLALLNYKNGDLTINNYLESVCMMLFWFMLLIMMFLTYRRLEDHSNRDKQWRDILIHYARERGCNTFDMEKHNRDCHMKERSAVIYPATLILVFYFVIFVLTVCYPKVVYYEWGLYISIYTVVAMGAIATVLMFFLVYTYSMRYPFAHEDSQIRFILSFRRTMANDGLDVPPMKPSVKHMWLIIHIFLFFFTGGIYMFYLLYMVYRSTNNHLYNQWSYEIQLMNAIVVHEGGIGIQIADEKKKKDKKKKSKISVEETPVVTETPAETPEEKKEEEPAKDDESIEPADSESLESEEEKESEENKEGEDDQ